MNNTVVVVLLLSVALALLWTPLMIGFTRVPRMDGDDNEAHEPALKWPPTKEDRVQVKRFGWLLVVWGFAFVLLLAAFLLVLRGTDIL